MNLKYLFISAVLQSATVAFASPLPALNESFQSASAQTEGDLLTVTTGEVTRQWRWTGEGLLTEFVKDQDGKIVAKSVGKGSDWDIGSYGEGKLLSLKAFRDNDEKFTSDHLAVEAEIDYGRLTLKYVIWAYPDAPGLRTQIWLKDRGQVSLGNNISESLQVVMSPVEVISWGYESGLKADRDDYEILRTWTLESNESVPKTNGLKIQLADRGLLLVKESHAHTNIPETKTDVGAFHREGQTMRVSGLGLLATDINSKYRFCWANWMILYQGSEIDAQLALKRFDRHRYPVHERDIFIMANTWGSEDARSQCLYKAREENVLREIESSANLGIDILQIDDGWQTVKWFPAETYATQQWRRKPSELLDGTMIPDTYDIYPEGFVNVRKAAREAGIDLGLWFSWRAGTEAIKTNLDNGDFKALKLDFAVLKDKRTLDGLYNKSRDIVKHSNYEAVVNWDLTELPPRMGFYFGREVGNLYLANRKATTERDGVLYNPWQILRDAWMLAKYTNLNKIQITFQNKDHLPEATPTNGKQYPHDYNLAITLMSSPILFLETQMLSEDAVGILKPMIASYKSERDAMYKGYVFALGDMPDNKSWTGLQNHNPETGKGYLSVFREVHNTSNETSFKLNFLEPGSKVEIEDIFSGEKRMVTLSDDSEISFQIEEAPGYQFVKYQPVK